MLLCGGFLTSHSPDTLAGFGTRPMRRQGGQLQMGRYSRGYGAMDQAAVLVQ